MTSVTKHPLAWHKECYRNSTEHLLREKSKLQRMTAEVAFLEESVKFYGDQIIEADRRGMAEFDRNRFLVPRPKKKP